MTKTTIEWSEEVWNPVRGCTKVSPGCRGCYAETFAERWRGVPGHPYEQGFDLRLVPDKLDEPFGWKRPRLVFVNSMSDLFHRDVPAEYIARVFARMAIADRHTFQVLTKRADRMRDVLAAPDFPRRLVEAIEDCAGSTCLGVSWPLPNVHLGVSVEDQRRADDRIPFLLETPAAVRWISAEPLLGALDLEPWLYVPTKCRSCGTWNEGYYEPRQGEPGVVLCAACRDVGVRAECDELPPLDWVVVGGESGPRARPMHPSWARDVRDQCEKARVPFFFKQWGAFQHGSDTDRRTLVVLNNGRTMRYPEAEATPDERAKWSHLGAVAMARVGKKRAGRELDGRTHDAMPGDRPVPELDEFPF